MKVIPLRVLAIIRSNMIPSISMLVETSIVLVELVLVDWWHGLLSGIFFEDRRRDLLIKSSEVRRGLSIFDTISNFAILIRVLMIAHDLQRTLCVVSIKALFNIYKYGIRYKDLSDID